MDLYTVLGVTRTASAGELKAAFRKKALQYHPDRHADSPTHTQAEAARHFKQAKDAYEILSNGVERDLYNRQGHTSPGAGQTPRGPAGYGGAYGSGYGDAYSRGFGTVRSRSGWSNFWYQQRQHNRHDWFFRPFAAAARGMGRGDAAWHAAMGGVLLVGFLALAPMLDAAWERQNSGKLFRHIAPDTSSEEEEERVRRRLARMRWHASASAGAGAGAPPKLTQAGTAAAAAAAAGGHAMLPTRSFYDGGLDRAAPSAPGSRAAQRTCGSAPVDDGKDRAAGKDLLTSAAGAAEEVPAVSGAAPAGVPSALQQTVDSVSADDTEGCDARKELLSFAAAAAVDTSESVLMPGRPATAAQQAVR